MLNDEEYASDSESSDDDYCPEAAGEAGSEEEESGEEEDLQLLKDTDDGETKLPKKRKLKQKENTNARKRKGGIRLEEEVTPDGTSEPATPSTAKEDTYNKELAEQIEKEKQAKKEEEEKKKADSLWASFMSDVGGPKPKPKTTPSSGLGALTKPVHTLSSKSPASSSIKPKSASTITITKEYDFAGETVKVTKEVAADSKEAKAELKKQEEKEEEKPATTGPILKPTRGGLGSVLGKIGKKDKISTLLKSKLDWDSFKQKEGIDEELATHNRGKEGYVERQAFLQRTDLRQFEIEKNLRLSSSKR